VSDCCFIKAYKKKKKEQTGWLGILCPSGTKCLSEDCCFSELASVGLEQSGPHHRLIDN
jgi:hypothetical protein